MAVVNIILQDTGVNSMTVQIASMPDFPKSRIEMSTAQLLALDIAKQFEILQKNMSVAKQTQLSKLTS